MIFFIFFELKITKYILSRYDRFTEAFEVVSTNIDGIYKVYFSVTYCYSNYDFLPHTVHLKN